jgi:phage terminase large subunit GpA-like protein
MRMLDWAVQFARNEFGQQYSHNTYPHIGAPGGPFDAIDCTQYMTIWLQWASRLGKTFLGQVAMMKLAHTDPCPMMFASVDEKLATEVTARTYRMLELCQPMRERLLPKNRRRQNFVDLRDCRMAIAWSRSVSTLADKPVKFGLANEVDKWEQASTSSEADPLKLFTDRFKQFPIYKRIIESTPAMKSTSRVERGRLGSTNCHLWVPCPHCGEYQVLKMEHLVWDKLDGGKSDKTLALQTARYVCPHCKGEARDNHRGAMMRAGVWCPEGCTVDNEWARECAKAWKVPGAPFWQGWKDSPWIKGTPARDGRDAGYQLPSLYALARGWGEIAEEWVGSQKNPQNLRNFINQWMAETWELASRKETWEKIAGRLIDQGSPRGVAPLWASMLTAGVDRQGREGGKFPWIVLAWGPGNRCHVVSYGECDTFEGIEAVLKADYPHADGGNPLRIAYTFFDSGYRPDGVYEFSLRMLNQGIQCWPVKGSNTALSSDFQWSTLGENTSRPGMRYCMIDTIRSQLWVESRIFDVAEPRITTIHADSTHAHQDFIEQVLNDAPVEGLDSRNNARESWQRINEGLPNDWRDTWRYAWCGLLNATGGRDVLPRKYREPPPAEPEQPGRIRTLKIRGR